MIIDRKKLYDIIKVEADYRKVCAIDVMAIVKIESSMDIFAIRTEKQNPWLYRCDYYAKKITSPFTQKRPFSIAAMV